MPYIGAGGQSFQSSVLAKASMPGGYSTTRRATPEEMAKYWPQSQGSSGGSNVSPGAMTAILKALAQYAPGGGFGKDIEAGLERGRVQSTASGMQNLVGAGLAGTTMAAGLGKKYEAEVAAPTRAQMESTRAQSIAALQSMLAQMEQSGFQANLDRSFQASQSLMSRPQSSIASYTPSLPGRSAAPPVAQITREQPTSMTTRERPSVVNSAIKANNSQSSWVPGGYMGSINGERWVYGQNGEPVRG